MPINNGVVLRTVAGVDGEGEVVARCFYDATQPRPGQPLIDDPTEGAALVVTNSTGGSVPVTLGGAFGTVRVPVGRTIRTAAQLAAIGLGTREDAETLSIANA